MSPFTLDDMLAIVKPHNDKIVAEHKLDLAWQRIEALTNQRNRNDYEAGFRSAAEAALWIVEELGGQDPAKRARAELDAIAKAGRQP